VKLLIINTLLIFSSLVSNYFDKVMAQLNQQQPHPPPSAAAVVVGVNPCPPGYILGQNGLCMLEQQQQQLPPTAQTPQIPLLNITTPTNGTGSGQFDLPEDIAVDTAANVYVVDTLNNRIQKFDSNGNFITAWGSNGTGSGQFND
jgi:DNA-binding beta-propeller fold protein YncE